VTRHCVTHARCGVLVVPPPPLARAIGHGVLRRRRALHDVLHSG
jgi:hypothetical protein